MCLHTDIKVMGVLIALMVEFRPRIPSLTDLETIFMGLGPSLLSQAACPRRDYQASKDETAE